MTDTIQSEPVSVTVPATTIPLTVPAQTLSVSIVIPQQVIQVPIPAETAAGLANIDVTQLASQVATLLAASVGGSTGGGTSGGGGTTTGGLIASTYTPPAGSAVVFDQNGFGPGWQNDESFGGIKPIPGTANAIAPGPYALYCEATSGNQGGWQPCATNNAQGIPEFDTTPYQFLTALVMPGYSGEGWQLGIEQPTSASGESGVGTGGLVLSSFLQGPVGVLGQSYGLYKIPLHNGGWNLPATQIIKKFMLMIGSTTPPAGVNPSWYVGGAWFTPS